MNPRDCKYSREHEWVRAEPGGVVTVGITQYAQEQLGDLVYFDLPSPGAVLKQFAKLGEVESVKAVSDVYAPVSGQVVEVNGGVIEHPEVVNQDPYGKGWLLRVRLSQAAELGKLMSAQEYEAMLQSLT